MKKTEQSLVNRLNRTGDTQDAAINELREILVERMGISFRNNNVVDDAFVDDIVQDALIKILKSIQQFEGRAKFTTWATSIAIRTAYTELRRKHWKDVSLDSLIVTQGDSVPAKAGNPNEATEQQAMINAMHIAIKEKLTEKQRVALMAELSGMPMEEIGRRTGSNRNAIYKLTHDARKRLRIELESNGFTAEDFLTSIEAT